MSQLGLVNPASPGEITQAGMLVAMSSAAGTPYPSSSKPVTSALATGFRQIGVLSALPKFNLGRETEEVKTGIYGITQEILFKGFSGTVECEFFGVDPYFMSVALGVTPVVTSAASPTTTTGALTVDSTTGNTVVPVTSASGFSVGDMIQVDETSAAGFSTNMARILQINSLNILCDRLLRDMSPTTGANVAKVVNVMMPIGGTAPAKYSFAGVVDFPDGRVGLISLPKVYSSKPLNFGLGNETAAVKIPVTFDAIGVLDSTYGVLLGKIFIFS